MEEAEIPQSDQTPQETAEQEQAAQEEPVEETTAEEPPEDFPLPPASFEFLILSLRSQAEMQLGLLHFGEEKDRPKPNLRLTSHTIDLLAMLLEKTKGNLSMDEQRMLENSLTELRFRFVQASDSSSKQ